MDEEKVSRSAKKLAAALSVLRFSAERAPKAVAITVLQRISTILEQHQADIQYLEVSFNRGDPKDVVPVGRIHYPNAHVAAFKEASLTLKMINLLVGSQQIGARGAVDWERVEDNWPAARNGILEMLTVEWKRDISIVRARISRESNLSEETEVQVDSGTSEMESLPADNGDRISYTKQTINQAIREYVAERSARYAELAKMVAAGTAGAVEAADALFGRAALARKLRPKSPSMISQDDYYRQIAAELGFDRQRRHHTNKIGLEIALEETPPRSSESSVALVEPDSAERQIRAMQNKGLKASDADQLIDAMRQGKCTPDEALDTARTLVEEP